MEFFKELLELNNKNYLEELSKKKYPIIDTDIQEDKDFMISLRNKFIQLHNKKNNRLFIKSHSYKISDYELYCHPFKS